ncbi:MAG: LPS-assembly protein LptD [Deltaproteobacteria bacterium]|nr:LPS-assembly protein LptD [Deltaproteobacteria bacterium]
MLTSLRFTSIFLIGLLFLAFNSQDASADDRFSKASFLGQGDEPWKIRARNMSYSDREGIYDAEGDVVISRGEEALYAQKARYNMKTGIAEVEGDVRMESGGDILTGEKGVFDFKKQTGKIINGSLFLKDNHFYIMGGLMEKLGEDTYLVRDCRVTTCDGENPTWSISGSEVKVTVEGYGTVRNAALRIRNIPVLYVPYMIFPAKTKRQTGLLPPRVGHSSRNGTDVEVPFFWAISDQTDATFYQRYMSKRGYMQGLEFRYVSDDESKGNFLFDILSDSEDKDMNDPDDVQMSPYSRTNQTRYWFRGRADQDLPNGLVAHLDADYVSDQDYLNEFETEGSGFGLRPDLAEESGRPVEEKRSPIRTSALRVSRDAENYSLQALGSYYQLPGNPDRHETAEPLGGLLFSLLPSSINGFPAFFTLESNYDYVWRDEGLKGHSFSLSPELRLPLRFGRYVEFEPSIRYTLDQQWFGYTQGDMENQSLKTYEASAKMSTSIDRIFDLEFKGARRLKHKIRPTLGYTYRGFQDEDDQSPWFEPMEEEGDANLVTLAIENFLDARIEDNNGNVSYRQWAKFTLIQRYDVEEKRRDSEPGRDREPFEPLRAELTLSPFQELNVFADVEWDHYDNKITYADLSLVLAVNRSGGRMDRFILDYQYDIDDQKSVSAWFDVNLIYGLSAGSSFERDLDLKESISNRYWLKYQRQCWGVKFIVEDENDETSFMLSFQLLGFGEVEAL